MTSARIDLMIERAAEVMCNVEGNMDGLPRVLAREWPQAPALELTVALASAADGVQSLMGCAGPSGHRAQTGWQLAAMVAADVHFLAVTGAPNSTAADLLAYWTDERGSK